MSNKKIEFEYKGNKYLLEYNRQAVEYMERNGFVVGELASKPMMMLPMAFQGLFFKNHKSTPVAVIDEIYDSLKEKNSLLQTIVSMLNETYESLQAEPSGKEGNIEWKVL